LPPTIEVDGTSYRYQAIEQDIEVEDLVQIDVVETEETTITLYVEPDVGPGPAPSVFAVPEGSDVVASYVPAAGGMVPSTGSGSGVTGSRWDLLTAALLAAAVAAAAAAVYLAAGKRARPR
jgi:hypothetical protein